MSSDKYPIAEIFTSVQGEGAFTGTVMMFVRLAGCSVGKPMTKEQKEQWLQRVPKFSGVSAQAVVDAKAGTPPVAVQEAIELPVLQPYTEQCRTYDGRSFLCDTDFRTKSVQTVGQIFSQVPEGVQHLCITGGEPMMHDLMPMIREAWARGIHPHIETSGTQFKQEIFYLNREVTRMGLWITVSPKFGVEERALLACDEIKLLVDENFREEAIPPAVYLHSLVWLQPINYEWDINVENVKRCLALLHKHPNWRLSTQGHKIWKVR